MGFIEKPNSGQPQRNNGNPQMGPSAAELARIEIEQEKALAEGELLDIAELIDSLPPFSLRPYLKTVTSKTGEESEIVLYSRLIHFPSAEERDALLKKTTLAESLREREIDLHRLTYPGIDRADGGVEYSSTPYVFHPASKFNGHPIKPRVFPWIRALSEPEEPGLGIAFKKEVGYLKYSAVYLRIYGARQAVLTGNGSQVEISSLEVLDDALFDAFNHRHKFEYRLAPYNGPVIVGNG